MSIACRDRPRLQIATMCVSLRCSIASTVTASPSTVVSSRHAHPQICVGVDRRLLGHGFEACDVDRHGLELLVRCSLRHNDLQSLTHADVSRPGVAGLAALLRG
jgi:hypothetical protein